jgi:4-hydroxy-4-methyl-2-oxoglutarate aldolase
MSYIVRPMPEQIPAALLEKAQRVETATVGHRRHMGFLSPAIQAILPGRRIAGTAVTLALPGQDSTLLHHVVQFLRPGDVLVMSPREAESDIDWALGKQAAEPAGHEALRGGAALGERSGASAQVEAKLRASA